MDSAQRDTHNREEHDRRLAALLGITYEELLQLHHHGLQEVTDSEQQIYKYFIRFGKDSPANVLDKMNLDHDMTAWIRAADWGESGKNANDQEAPDQ